VSFGVAGDVFETNIGIAGGLVVVRHCYQVIEDWRTLRGVELVRTDFCEGVELVTIVRHQTCMNPGIDHHRSSHGFRLPMEGSIRPPRRHLGT